MASRKADPLNAPDSSVATKIDNALVVLDVGHGICSVLLDGNSVVVIDTGPGASLLEFLREQQIHEIETVLLSHADQDHIGGLSQLVASRIVSIGKVRLNTDSLKGSASWDDLVFELSENPSIDFQPVLTTDNSGEFNTDRVSVEIAAPSTYLASKGPGSSDRNGRKIVTNSISAVIRLSFENRPIALLPGDLDYVGLQNLLENDVAIDAPLVVFPHHGGRPGAAKVAEFVSEFIDATSPNVVVFSIGRGRHGNPRPEIVDAVRSRNTGVRIICTQLSEHCAPEIAAETSSEHLGTAYARGKSKQECCGGTVVLYFETNELHPSNDAHQHFISITAGNPLCQK